MTLIELSKMILDHIVADPSAAHRTVLFREVGYDNVQEPSQEPMANEEFDVHNCVVIHTREP